MYVCMNMYMYGHDGMQTYIHTYIHIYIHTCRRSCAFQRQMFQCWDKHTCIHTYMHAYIHTHIDAYIQTILLFNGKCFSVGQAYMHTYIHTYIRIHIYIHTYRRSYAVQRQAFQFWEKHTRRVKYTEDAIKCVMYKQVCICVCMYVCVYIYIESI